MSYSWMSTEDLRAEVARLRELVHDAPKNENGARAFARLGSEYAEAAAELERREGITT